MLNIVIFTEQDEGLDILAEVVARQKSMATDIGTEIDRQDGMIRQKAYNIIYRYMLYSIYNYIIYYNIIWLWIRQKHYWSNWFGWAFMALFLFCASNNAWAVISILILNLRIDDRIGFKSS